ncbi:hypothetical protein IMG5_169460 [Ichthyophthirius multifiliis]|uniref:Uncharacterized protein n=1 Tax=Ichthyophthirius multifiliis TaxID=5932 RepID=G0R1B6_ICHMU|nr:hypothetical protein IMG5_169460 [Ichthyophthirius multifiliis]EGR28749.1 hypothetical protein IMG5_169460 [Ichthyophthirius multifiliis]|eukprot:XP_004029985.1 hypothetical protein IMG5_169460 [Ichthyophthirius multifiliis]
MNQTQFNAHNYLLTGTNIQRHNTIERSVIQMECKLYEFYEKFVKVMGYFAKLKNKYAKQQGQEISDKLKEQYNELRLIGSKSLLNLLKHLYHFNFSKEIAEFVVHKICSIDLKVQEPAKSTIKKILSDPTHSLYEIKVVLLKEMGKMLNQTSEKDLPDDFIEIINNVSIDSKYLKKDLDEEKKKKIQDAFSNKIFFFFNGWNSQKHSKINRMLDDENDGFGLNRYNEKIEDPQTTNAINTSINEDISKISNQTKSNEIKNIVNKILKQEPLHPSLSSLSVVQFYQKYQNL